MRFSIILLALISLITLCVAEIDDPSSLSDIKLRIVENGSIETPSFRLDKICIDLIMPQGGDNQAIGFYGESTRDKFGNKLAYIEERNPPRILYYSKEFRVNISERKTTSIPSIYEIPDDVKVYLKPTENIQSDDPGIKELSKSIADNSINDFEKISRLAIWVHDNIEYRKDLGNESKDARWVFENKFGTCDEFSTLFIALSRSIGIPARFVAGYSYGDGGWGEHAFSEAYVGGWIPVDATNLDVGRVDATHIKFAVSNDNIVSSKIKAYGADASKIVWKSKTDISVLNYTKGEKPDYELLISSDEVHAGDSAVVILKIKAGEYAVFRVNLQPCTGDIELIEIDDSEKDVILEPGRERIVFWRIRIPEKLRGSMLYTCPLTLNSKFLYPKDVTLNVNTQKQRGDESSDIEFTAELGDPTVNYGRNETIFLNIKRLRGGDPVKIGLISGNHLREFYVKSEGIITLSFKPEQLGGHEAVIYSSTGRVLTLNYTVNGDKGVYIEKIEIPSMIKKNDGGDIKLWIKNDRPSIQELKLYVNSSSSEIIKSLSVENISTVRIPLNINNTGVDRFTFRLVGSRVDIKTVRDVAVYDIPAVDFNALYSPHEKKVSVTLDVSRDTARNIEINIDNETKYIPELFGRKNIEFNMDVKNPEVTITYEDLSGMDYSLKESMEIKEENPLERVIRMLSEFIQALINSFS